MKHFNQEDNVNSNRLNTGPEMWSLARLYKECSLAPVVFLGLCQLVGEQNTFRLATTRRKLGEITGITREASLSKSLSALDTGRWIDRIHILKRREEGAGLTTLLQIIVLNKEHFPLSIQTETLFPNKERETLSTSKKRERSISLSKERDALSIGGAPRALYSSELETFVTEFYRALGKPVQKLQSGCRAIQELLDSGRTPEEISSATQYIARHRVDGTFDSEPRSPWFLKSVIDDALAEEAKLTAKRERLARLQADDAQKKAALDEEAALYLQRQTRNGIQ